MKMRSPTAGVSSLAYCNLCSCPARSVQSSDDDDLRDSKSTRTSVVNRRIFEAKTASSFFPGMYFTTRDLLLPLRETFAQFMEVYPAYAETRRMDIIRAEEYYHLSISNHVCLDYIGIGLFSYAESQNLQHFSTPPQEIPNFPLFSLHYREVNFKSHLIQDVRVSGIEQAMKRRIMDFLNISEKDYSIVFTVNRTSAFRVVADSYPFKSCPKLLSVYDHDNEAVDAMIESAERERARVLSAEFTWPRLRIHSDKLKETIIGKRARRKKQKRGLFVFPLHSRVTGVRYSYQWAKLAQEKGWSLLLDVCALGPKDMDSLGLSLLRPDFIVCSFYKIFGQNPTGFGCLLVNKSTVPMLESPVNAGILSLAKSSDSSSIEVECRGLLHVDSLGLIQIGNRARYLVNWLVNAMGKLQHSKSGKMNPLVRIYGPKTKFNRGPALAFNLFDLNNNKIEPVLVQKLASGSCISLGSGFLQRISFLDEEEVLETRPIAGRGILGSRRESRSQMGITVLTAALGFLSNFEDVYRLWAFLAQFLDSDRVEQLTQRYTVVHHNIIPI